MHQVGIRASSRRVSDRWKTTSSPTPSCKIWPDSEIQFQLILHLAHTSRYTASSNPPPPLPLSQLLVSVAQLLYQGEETVTNLAVQSTNLYLKTLNFAQATTQNDICPTDDRFVQGIQKLGLLAILLFQGVKDNLVICPMGQEA